MRFEGKVAEVDHETFERHMRLNLTTAADYGPQGVRVNAVCPGGTRIHDRRRRRPVGCERRDARARPALAR